VQHIDTVVEYSSGIPVTLFDNVQCLEEIVKVTQGRKLFLKKNNATSIRGNNIIFFVDNHTKTFDAGIGMAADLHYGRGLRV